MSKEPEWILPKVVRAVHKRQIAEHGGLAGIRDEALLESALARPLNSWHYRDPKPDILFLATDYAFGLSHNHPFLDGNKRTTFVVCSLFLSLNGYKILASPQEKYETFLKLASSDLIIKDFHAWLQEVCEKNA